MKPLGRFAIPFDGACMPRVVWGRTGAGARLGSAAETPGVEDMVRIAPAEEVAEESAPESGFVGFLRYAGDVRVGLFDWRDKHTFEVPTPCPYVFSPTPYRVEK